jgi:hypothetical protein
MNMNQAQLDTVNGITPKGFHINDGEPCECGGDKYVTTKERKYSDSMVYYHHCKECGNDFSTWIEG